MREVQRRANPQITCIVVGVRSGSRADKLASHRCQQGDVWLVGSTGPGPSVDDLSLGRSESTVRSDGLDARDATHPGGTALLLGNCSQHSDVQRVSTDTLSDPWRKLAHCRPTLGAVDQRST